MCDCSEHSWIRICESEKLKINRSQFWQAIWIWIMKPNVVNRRLFASEILHCFQLESDHLTEDCFFNINLKYDNLCDEGSIVNCLKEKLNLKSCVESDVQQFSSRSYLLIKKIYFRNRSCSDFLEICCINYVKNFVLHHPIYNCSVVEKLSSVFPLLLKFSNAKIDVKVLSCWRSSISLDWLNYLLLPKLIKWTEKADSRNAFEIETDSLKLISVSVYNELYFHWKSKYGKQLVENWIESTDPSKFVYEDIAIAAYLSLLWKNEKVNFVDLGCGNGLLVYILSQEGHTGFGIDVRPRRIWAQYPPSTILKVGTVSPNSNWNYPQVDWIIGNHSDELTPWIPVFAASSSYDCKFFLLPCCAYEFNGRRYQRQNSAVSCYNDYIEYVKTVSLRLGFDIMIDKLRIPSTKRICLVGHRRTYPHGSYENILKEQVEPVFKQYSLLDGKSDFIPRNSVESVRNCTRIDRTISLKIESSICQALIEKQLSILQKKHECDIWSEDYSISFNEAISLLHSEDLKKLKNECGGLKTLLRNNHSVYLIRENRIFFRKPTENSVSSKWKTRTCWFFHNHPLSCPIPENKCSFVH